MYNELPGYNKRSENSMIAVVPDITSDGSRIYGKSLSWEVLSGNYKPNLKKDYRFLNLMLGQLPKLTSEILKIINLANKLDIILPKDGELAELVVHPNSTWELTMIDIKLARKRMRELESRADVISLNKSLGVDLLRELKYIQSKI